MTNNSIDLTIHSQFVEYGRNAKEWLRKCALLLLKIDQKQIWKKKGFSSIFEYAAKLAGMSRSSVIEALRVLSRIEKMPELLKVVEEKGIQRVRPVAAIATVETAAFWAEKARTMSKHTLEIYVQEYKKQFGLEPISDDFGDKNLQVKSLPGETTHQFRSEAPRTEETPQPENATTLTTKTISMTLSPDVAAKLEKLKGQGNWEDLMRELLKIREEKLEVEKPKPVETSSRHIPAKVKNFAIEKTRGQCAYPGCTKPYNTLHHTQRFALDHVHDPDHLVPLCEVHEHLAHHGLIANEDLAPEKWEILLEPEWWDLKQVVDHQVAKHRNFE